ncbi:MFS transporter [Streptomyces sp. NPDC006923]|uniref:MFS transporter n=1 Tax=Streptomyces sp. NPDC006923 TaxID=3155355 RepID=UPI00340FD618
MLAILLVGAFMPTLDFFIVNVAVPSITEDLRATSGEVQLVVAAYAIVYACLLVLGGRLGDHWGPKKAFVVGTALFTATSAMCGFAPDVWWLICGRALQGGASVVLFPQVLALIRLHYPPAERPRVMRFYGLATGGAMAVGQLLGGLLISLDWLGLSWRWAFLVNLPVGVVTLLLAPRLLPATRRLGSLRIDRTGILLFAVAMVLLVVPLTVGRSAGWPGWTLLMLVGASVSLPGFWLWERRVESRGRDPLLPPSLLRAGTLRMGLLTVCTFYASMSSSLYVLALLLQQGRGLTPLQSGLVSSPLMIGFCAASLASSSLTERWGPRALMATMGIRIIGFAGQFLLLLAQPRDVNIPALAALLAVNGACTGAVMAPLLGIVLDGLKPAQAGAASGLLATTQQVAGSVGLAVIGIVFHGAARRAAPDPEQIATGYRHGLVFLVLTSAAALAGLFLLTRVRTGRGTAGTSAGGVPPVPSKS